MAAVLLSVVISGCASETSVQPPTAEALPRPDGGRSEPPSASDVVIGLSAQARQVSQFAARRGDQDFLMVDKARGRIILFRNGVPIFTDATLTGASTADRFPPGTLDLPFEHALTTIQKVTPAGRLTVVRQYDELYGPLFDINEVRGEDWGIAIHPLYLGLPKERRLDRLRTMTASDNHITFGCINIAPDAIQYLVRQLPEKAAIPLYILPLNERATGEFFPGPG